MKFNLASSYKPSGDQPKAIVELVQNIKSGLSSQVLLGVTGSGKTFTIANTIQELNRPTLVISHNKTLAAQLYSELKAFFPDNTVEYFVSYYDYYQPEVYLPTNGLYIEKGLAINEELERLRLSSITALLSGRRDIIVVASVSCIYGLSKPETFKENSCHFTVGMLLARNVLLKHFVDMLYSRSDTDWKRGNFRVMGDTIDLFVAYSDVAYRFIFWGDELETIYLIDPATGRKLQILQEVLIFPANLFVTSKEVLSRAMHQMQLDLGVQVAHFEEVGKLEEAKRLKERTELDLEMLRELGYCTGIENYSRYMDGREAEERPFCLLDYFPKDYIMVIDESHVTIPQFRAMWRGDRARKINLVEHGFRLPAAMDNRPLRFNEFEQLMGQVIFVSATPADYELEISEGAIVEQVIRPTGLLDPIVDVRPTTNQIHDILSEIAHANTQGVRTLVTTLTKRMAEELTAYLIEANIRCRYIHSEVKTLDRIDILNELRNGIFDVLVGVNLLREGLDLPQAALMIILDADKEGFLRNERSLIQTIGRVARHPNGKVIMYADRITSSMDKAINETARRRAMQMAYNLTHHITPSPVKQKEGELIIGHTPALIDTLSKKMKGYNDEASNLLTVVEDNATPYNDKKTKAEQIKILEMQMYKAASKLDFLEADRIKTRLDGLKQKVKR